ncbi:MAG: hypothetical protein KUG71_01290 [Porticoccaceae bacterium]|nr:hypothetical protein [Porticoccaceae bacterium]
MEKRIGIAPNAVLPILNDAVVIKCHKRLTTKDVWVGSDSKLSCMIPESKYNLSRDGNVIRYIERGTSIQFMNIHGSKAFDVYYFVEAKIIGGSKNTSMAILSWNLDNLFGLTFKADY